MIDGSMPLHHVNHKSHLHHQAGGVPWGSTGGALGSRASTILHSSGGLSRDFDALRSETEGLASWLPLSCLTNFPRQEDSVGVHWLEGFTPHTGICSFPEGVELAFKPSQSELQLSRIRVSLWLAKYSEEFPGKSLRKKIPTSFCLMSNRNWMM